MKKNAIKIALVSLGLIGGVVIGGVATDLASPDPIGVDTQEIGTQEVVKPIIEACAGEEIDVGGQKVCMEKSNYNLLKTALKNNKIDDEPLYLWTQTGAIHLAVINNEIKKQGSNLELSDINDASEIFEAGNALLN